METTIDPGQFKDYDKVQKLRPIDDEFMRCLFKDNIPLVQFVLRILTNKPDLVVTKLETRRDLKKLMGARSICLDAYASDSRNKKYDIEIQRQDRGAQLHRARYYSSALDAENLKAGQKFEELPDTYVIFITEKDFFGEKEAVYPIERVNMKTGKPFNDGEHILYVNGEYRGDSAIGKLMHDFNCSDPNEMNYEMMAKSARFYKESPKGVSEVSAMLDELREEGRREGRKEGIKEGEQKGIAAMVHKMLADGGFTTQKIAEISGLSVEEIEKLRPNPAN